MGQSSLKIVPLPIPTTPQPPRYLNSSHLPPSGQLQLSDLITRFDRLMLERPDAAAQILMWGNHLLRIFNA